MYKKTFSRLSSLKISAVQLLLNGGYIRDYSEVGNGFRVYDKEGNVTIKLNNLKGLDALLKKSSKGLIISRRSIQGLNGNNKIKRIYRCSIQLKSV